MSDPTDGPQEPARTATPPDRRPGGRTARVRAQVLEAVRAELGEHGYEGLTMEGVAARAGCPPDHGLPALGGRRRSARRCPRRGGRGRLGARGHGLPARRPDGPQRRDPGVPGRAAVDPPGADGRLVPLRAGRRRPAAAVGGPVRALRAHRRARRRTRRTPFAHRRAASTDRLHRTALPPVGTPADRPRSADVRPGRDHDDSGRRPCARSTAPRRCDPCPG